MANGSLQDFISLVKTKGLAKTSHFSVFFTPVTLNTVSNLNTESLMMFCSQVNLPGINIATNPAKIFGETFEFAYEKIYGPITLNFYVDANLEVKKIFDSWIEQIQDPITKKFGYYSDYTTDMEIFVYNSEQKKVYSMKLYEAYPKTISDIQMDYSASGGFMNLQVTFSYRFFETFGNIQSTSPNTEIPSNAIIDSNSGVINGDVPTLKSYVEDFDKFQKDLMSNVNDKISGATQKVSSTAKSAMSSILNKVKS